MSRALTLNSRSDGCLALTSEAQKLDPALRKRPRPSADTEIIRRTADLRDAALKNKDQMSHMNI